MLRSLLTGLPKEKASYNEKFAKHHVQSKIAIDHLTDTNIKKEVCCPEVNEDIQVNAKEQLQIKSEYLKSITYEQTEYQINDAYTEIKQEVPCEDFDDNQSMSKQFYPELHHILQHNKVSEENLPSIDIKKEVCYEKVKDDIQLNANKQLLIKSENAQSPISDEQIEYQFNNIQDEMMVDNKIGNNTTDSYFINENEKSKLLVPDIKVSNVYDHVLEINPFEYNNFPDRQNTPEQDAPKITVPETATLKKTVRVKTPAERSREYRARKKARQNAANQEPNDSTSIVTEIQQENSQSESSQESDGCSHILLKKRKTPADYSREYRARKKALKELQKKSKESEDDSLKSLIKPKTPAERSREYRARKRAYMDLEEPIPIAPSIEMVVSNNPCTVDQHSILPDSYFDTDIPNARTTSNNNNTEDFPDSRIQLHNMLHHIHNYISNKFSEEILTNTDTKNEVPNTEVNEDIKVNANEHRQVETGHAQDSISEREESKPEHLVPESIVNNIYDHILDIKQEAPSEYICLDDRNALSHNTYLQKDLRIKLEKIYRKTKIQAIVNQYHHALKRLPYVFIEYDVIHKVIIQVETFFDLDMKIENNGLKLFKKIAKKMVTRYLRIRVQSILNILQISIL